MKKKTFKKYKTKSEVFKKIWKHFVVDKNPLSYNKDKTYCLYSSTGCAIGCLIPDKKICRSWDRCTNGTGSDIKSIKNSNSRDFWKIFDKKSFSSKIGLRFLSKLQSLHDSSDDKASFVKSLEKMNSKARYIIKIKK